MGALAGKAEKELAGSAALGASGARRTLAPYPWKVRPIFGRGSGSRAASQNGRPARLGALELLQCLKIGWIFQG